jgi:hypothetical protein
MKKLIITIAIALSVTAALVGVSVSVQNPEITVACGGPNC